MELDEHVIELIEKKSKDDPYLFVSLRRTDSGNLLIDFDTKESEVNEAQRVTVRRTPSGTRLLDMHKNMINVLKETLSNEKPKIRKSKSIELSLSAKTSKHSDKDQLQPIHEGLKCSCPISSLATQHEPDIQDKEGYNINRPGPPLPLYSPPGKAVIDKYLPKPKLECTCPKTTPSSVCCKLNEAGLPQTEKPECICPKTDSNAVCCKQLLDTDKAANDIKTNIQDEKECICPPGPQATFKSKPETQDLDKNSLQNKSQKEKLQCTCPKTDPNSVCCKLLSEADLGKSVLSKGIKNDFDDEHECFCPPGPYIPFTPGTAITDSPQINNYKEKLKCTCPKTDPNLVCCKLSNVDNVVSQDIVTDEKKNLDDKDCVCPPIPPIGCISKPETIITKKGKLECTCPKATPSSVCCKLSDADVLLNNAEKEKLQCTCPKTSLNSVCCQLKSEVNVAFKDFNTYCEFPEDPYTHSWISATSRSRVSMDDSDFTSELKQLYKQGNANIALKVQGKSGVVRKLHTGVTRTPSGMIAMYGRHLSSLGDISFDEKEYPVFLSKTTSGTYFVNISQHNCTPNASLRKTPSGGILLVPKTPKGHEFGEFFKVKVGGVRDYPIELPAVLKTTPSENYVIVLDKEFEKRYRETVNLFIGEKSECIVNLSRTNSGYYLIDLDTDFEKHLHKKNALLVKSSSGNIKVLVHGPVFESIVEPVSFQSSSSSTKAFKELLSKLPASSREFHRGNLRKSKYLDKRASSDTQLIENVKVKLRDHKHLLSEPSAVLKKTASGQYAIVLNKESKKAFINNLQSYLTTNSQGMVPIKRSDSGEIVINLNNNDEGKGHYGSLKITSSGNMYVTVDEEVIKGMTKRPTENICSNADVIRSQHIQEILENPVNKAVTTTCNAKPDDNFCDTSKCVCDEFESDKIDWLQEHLAKQDLAKTDHKNSTKKRNAKLNTPKDKSPHIVIKPTCDCRSPPKKFKSTDQCYYLLNTVCPYRKDRYNDVSNEMLEISGLCNKTEPNKKRTKIDFIANRKLPNLRTGKSRQVWDSLSYLPPQLPPFLRNVNFQ